MKAIFFGSIGTLIETSEHQRNAFNQAFREHGLDWHWDRSLYQDMLGQSGGAARIERFAGLNSVEVDARAIHATKVALFHKALTEERLPARAGVAAVISQAQSQGLKLGVVSTTDKVSLELAIDSAPDLDIDRFDLVTSADLGLAQKPAPDAYTHALEVFDLSPVEATAIEDNEPGVLSAKAAGLRVVAFPGANTPDQDYSTADIVASANLKEAVYG